MDCQLLKIVPQYCLKIMLFASLNLEETILKETKQNISHQYFLILMSSNKKEKLVSNKSGQMIIYETFLQRLY